MEFLFLNNALNHFLQTIQNVWAPVFQMHGIAMLLTVSAVAFCIYMVQFGFTGDAPSFIIGMAYTVLALAVLHAIFIYSQQFAEDVLNGFITWGQETSGMSPAVLTPSGIMETGLQLARIFWTAGGHASWFTAPISAIETVICTIVVCVAFGLAAIVYLIALIEVWALIIAASVLLACAAMPWTWNMFPGWGLTVLSACIRIFFLLCVLAIGLAEATAWTEAMAATSGTISDNLSLMMQATIESLLFIGLVYYIPRLMARMVVGAADTMMHAGEAVLASIAALAASKAGSAALSAPRTSGNVIAQGVSTVKTVSQMLLR
jgi:P-type conjugative transfer protein TrbL